MAKLQQALALTSEHCVRSPSDPQCVLMRAPWAGTCSTANHPWQRWAMPWREASAPAACHGGRFEVPDALLPSLYDYVRTTP